MIGIKNKHMTLLNRSLNFGYQTRRWMEYEIPLSPEEKGDSFYLYGCKLIEEKTHDPQLEYFAKKSFNYVLDSLDNGLKFSEILSQSQENLSYSLSSTSLQTMLEGMLSNPKTNEAAKQIIVACDDLYMFTHITNEEFTQEHHLKRNTRENTNDYDSSNTNDHFIPLKKVEVSSDCSSSISTDTETSDSALFNNGNNNEIMLLTVISFGIIVFTAWYINKYYPQDVEETSENSDSYSIYEPLVSLHKSLVQFTCLMVPVIYLFYSYRYYYFYIFVKLKTRRRV